MIRESCEHIQDLLPAYLEEALGADERRAVGEHLAGCRACRLEAESWARLDGLLDEHLAAVEPVEEAEVEALVQRLREERPVWRIAPEPVRFWRSWAPAAAFAVAAVLLALVGSYTPGLDLAVAKQTVLDEAAAMAASSRELPRAAPEEAVALYADAATWPREAAEGARRQWGEGLGLVQALTRRVGLAPLATCVMLLLAANLMVARGVRGTPRSLQGG